MKTLMTVGFLMIASAFTASAQWYCEEDRDCSEGDFCATDKHCQTRTGPGMCPSTCGCPGAGPECIPPPPGFQFKSFASSISPSMKVIQRVKSPPHTLIPLLKMILWLSESIRTRARLAHVLLVCQRMLQVAICQ